MGDPYTTFTFKVKDSSGSYSSSSYDMSITVTEVNDPPTSANSNVTTNEDTDYTFQTTDFTFTDTDTGDTFAGIQVASLPAAGTLTCNSTAVTAGDDCADVTTLVFTPNADEAGDPYTTFTFEVKDSGGAYSSGSYQMSIAVTEVNDPPTSANSTITATVNTSLSFAASDFPFTDADSDTFAGVQVITLPTTGTLTCNGTAVIAGSDCADVTTLVFTPYADEAGDPYTSFMFEVKDSAGTYSLGSYVMTIVVGKQPQTTTFDKPADVGLGRGSIEVTATATSGLTITFQSDTPSVCSVVTGTNTVTLATTGTCTIRAQQPGNDAWHPAPDVTQSFTVVDGKQDQTITFSVLQNVTLGDGSVNLFATASSGLPVTFQSDTSSVCTVSGNVATLLTVGTCTIRAQQPGDKAWNPAPDVVRSFFVSDIEVSDFTKRGKEDTPLAFTQTDFSDATDSDQINGIKIVSLPEHGTLKSNTTAVVVDQEIALADIGTLAFTPDPDWNGTTSIGWAATNDQGNVSPTAKATLVIAPVNDAPTITNTNIRGVTNSSLTLQATDFLSHYHDIENDPLTVVKIQSLPMSGKLQLNGRDMSRYQEVSASALDTITFVPPEDWKGTTSFDWSASDGQTFAHTEARAIIEITAQNAAPTDILLSKSIVSGRQSSGSTIGELSVVDDDDYEGSPSFALVGGVKSDDNAKFAIEGATLKAATTLDPATYYVRVQATDSGGLTFEKSFTIVVSSEPLATVFGTVLLDDDDQSEAVGVGATIEGLRSDGKLDVGGISQDVITDDKGEFQTTLPVNKTYRVTVHTLPDAISSDYILPDPTTFTLRSSDRTKTLDTIVLPKAKKLIYGTVTYSGTNIDVVAPVITAINRDTQVKKKTTNAYGSYGIGASGGTWDVFLSPPIGEVDWVAPEKPKTVEFTKGPKEFEFLETNFAVSKATYSIKGRVVDHEGKPTTFDSGQKYTAMILTDMEDQRTQTMYLNTDGRFSFPVENGGAYRLQGFIDPLYNLFAIIFGSIIFDNFYGYGYPYIAPQEINGQSIDLGDIPFVRLQSKINGRVTGRDGSGVAGVRVVAWDKDKQFSGESDDEGFYEMYLPQGAWSVSPESGDPATAEFLFDGTASKVTLSKDQTEVTEDFVVSRAGQHIRGEMIDESGQLVDAQFFVEIIRPNRVRPAVSVPVEEGKFALRMPEGCANCTFRATPRENTSYSVIEGDDNPQREEQADGSLRVSYRVRLENGTLSGTFLDSQTGQPVTGVRGDVTLSNAKNSYNVRIGTDASYLFENVSDGTYTLAYELERETGEVLANKVYMPVPTEKETVVMENGAVVPVAGTAGARVQFKDIIDLITKRGKSFSVSTNTTCPTVPTLQDDTETQTKRLYPAVVVCRHSDGKVVKTPCEAQEDDTVQCYTPVVEGEQPVCTVEFGDSAINQTSSASDASSITVAGSSADSLAEVFAAIDHIIEENGDPAQVKQLLQGKAVKLASLEEPILIARRPQGQTNPRRVKVGGETQRNGEPIETSDRPRDTYVFGMLLDESGKAIQNQVIDITAVAGGNDGQVRTFEAKNGYYLFEVAESQDDWTITASTEQGGSSYQATTIINVAELAENGIVMVPDLTLQPQGSGSSSVSQTFDGESGTQITVASSGGTQTQGIAAEEQEEVGVTIEVPPGAIPEDAGSQFRVTVDEVSLPSTGFDLVIGNGYRVAFVDRETGLPLMAALESPLEITLPYESATLATQGIAADQLQAATFSEDTKSWTPLSQSKVDTASEVVRARLDEVGDAVALIAPKPEPSNIATIPEAGEPITLSFQLREDSTLMSVVEIPAGLTVQPGVGLAAEVTPIAVAEARITSPVQPSQDLNKGGALIGGFTIDLFDQQGAPIPQGQLSSPMQMTLRFDPTSLPTSALLQTTGVEYRNTTASMWYPLNATLATGSSTIAGGTAAEEATTIVEITATTSFAGTFAATAYDYLSLYLPLIAQQ